MVTATGCVRKRALLHGVRFSYLKPEHDGVTGSCGLEDAVPAARCRPLIISSSPRTALLRRDGAVGTDGHLGAEHLMKHTLFKNSSSPESIPFFPNNPSISHLAWQHAEPICRGDGGSVGIAFCKACVSHDHSRKAYMHGNRCIFISLHDSSAISCLVFVFTWQVLWVVLQNSRPVHKFLCVAEIGLWGGSSAPNELFPSSVSLSCRLVSTHIWHLCNQLSELLSCWTGRPRRQTNGCYSDVRRAFKRLSLRSAFVDDWLWSLMAWHNHLHPYLTSSPELSFHPPLYSLCISA